MKPYRVNVKMGPKPYRVTVKMGPKPYRVTVKMGPRFERRQRFETGKRLM